MTNVHIIHDPFTDTTRIIYETHEISAADNKIVMFLKTSGFYECLHMFNKKYAVWQGLLPEIINEINDDELNIIFEGNKKDFETLEAAFYESKDTVKNMGYENNWNLSHIDNFSVDRAIEDMKDIVSEFREYCETRKELLQLNECISALNADTYMEIREKLIEIFNCHIQKWQESDNKYKQEKTDYINILINKVNMRKF